MAYTNAPINDTYRTEKVNLYREVATRDSGASGKDEDYLNVFIELVRQSKAEDARKFIQKRSGSVLEIASVSAANIRGMYFWSDQQTLFYCVGRNVYVYNVNTAISTTLTNVFATSTGEVGFCEYLYDTGTVKVLATDGSATSGLVTIDSANTVVTCSDVDLPAHLPNPVFIDGYVFLVEAATGKIFNSDNTDPLSWSTTAYVLPEQEADKTVKLAKINNYLVAFGNESIEYYWDAANAAPDSPMQRNDAPLKYNGFLGGLGQYGNSLFFIGKDAGGQPDIFKLSDFKIEGLGTPAISRYLNNSNANISTWLGNIVSMQGHTFYIISCGLNKTWAIDLDSNLVSRFAFQAGQTLDLLYAVVVKSSSTIKTYFCLNNSTSAIYKFDALIYQDAGVNFTCNVTTENNDFGTLNKKTMSRLGVLCDRPSTDTYLNISWSDDDYISFSTARACNLNADVPFLRQLGSFRNRVFKFTYTDNFPLRLSEVEVDINKGIR
jgi:hypothetical protein